MRKTTLYDADMNRVSETFLSEAVRTPVKMALDMVSAHVYQRPERMDKVAFVEVTEQIMGQVTPIALFAIKFTTAGYLYKPRLKWRQGEGYVTNEAVLGPMRYNVNYLAIAEEV